ncbi:DUF3726 domain-containing protein [Candidatus Pelagibacter communis]|uniref:DUF3726 domain-containing protein n=1 Tax=Pelagibacter ubique TaxID=198252 RepID=UPI00094DE32B|nr:DUF3726 domain-containing protein [Candidatus Pelagibacter ubique]|tara:strand:+ start:3141 stop:3752 length:612 start_codon:yes stop_codon:yes gene_type:complete
MKSLSEIETTSKRASRAAGFSWGIAEEIGKNIRLLELFGLEGIKSLNKYYISRNQEKFESISLITENNNSKKYPYCPILLGISILDQIKNLEKFKMIKFDKISFPLLILPFLSRSSEIIGKRIRVKFDQAEYQLNFNINILSNKPNQIFLKFANNVEIFFLENTDNFSEVEWKSLYKLSEETFVEESDSLKNSAAGAGLTDND